MKTPVTIAVTGAAGQISYVLLFRLIFGDLLGPDQPIALRLLEVPEALPALDGVVMELVDCASPLLSSVTVTSSPEDAFDQADLVFLVGARPRGPGMERKDLLEVNAAIFSRQGQALNATAKRDAKILIVGNPANTNALIALSNAPDLDPRNFSAMTRLDHNRAVSLLALKCSCGVDDVRQIAVWGNHSTTQFPDISHATVRGEPALAKVDPAWFADQFVPTVQQRGAAVIQVRGKSSAASAANAALSQMRDWVGPNPTRDWVSMAVYSDGSYGISGGIVYSFPVIAGKGEYRIVQNLPISEFAHQWMRTTEQELVTERALVEHLLKPSASI